MAKISLVKQLANTVITDAKSIAILGEVIRNSFDQTKSASTAFDLLAVAWKYQIPQFDQMLEDFDYDDFNPFS